MLRPDAGSAAEGSGSFTTRAGSAPDAGEHNAADLFRATLDAVPDAVLIVDDQGVIVTANIQVEAIFGYRPDELEHQLIEMLVPSRVRAGHPHRRSGYTHRPMGLLQLAAVKKDGTEFPAEISLAPVAVGEGSTLTAATVRDLTDRLRLAAEADRLRDEMLATVTHELRTPLTVIIGYATLLLGLDDTDIGSTARHMITQIAKSAERELTLVNDLLTMAVGNLGSMKLSLRDVDLDEMIGITVSERRAEAVKRGLTLERSSPISPRQGGIGEGVPPWSGRARVDPERLRQVLDNLIGNAIKFTPAGGRIEVDLTALEDSIVVKVADSGRGIAASEQEHVFDRLYRARAATIDAVPGAGLGLSIAKAIVEAHHGTITLTSTLGVGTEVTVQVPRRG